MIEAVQEKGEPRMLDTIEGERFVTLEDLGPRPVLASHSDPTTAAAAGWLLQTGDYVAMYLDVNSKIESELSRRVARALWLFAYTKAGRRAEYLRWLRLADAWDEGRPIKTGPVAKERKPKKAASQKKAKRGGRNIEGVVNRRVSK